MYLKFSQVKKKKKRPWDKITVTLLIFLKVQFIKDTTMSLSKPERTSDCCHHHYTGNKPGKSHK